MTTADTIEIAALRAPLGEADLAGLSALLLDAVESGASVSFMAGVTDAELRGFWTDLAEGLGMRGVMLVARDGEGIAGTITLKPAWAPNQPHRAELTKLLVHRRARRHGLGERLMRAIEQRAWDAGFTLLTLDTVRGDAADRLYRRIGWSVAGVVPDFALHPDGRLCDTVVFYKRPAGRG